MAVALILKQPFFATRGDFSQDSFALCIAFFCCFLASVVLFWLLWLLQLVWFLLACLLRLQGFCALFDSSGFCGCI